MPNRWETGEACPASCGGRVIKTQSGIKCCSSYDCSWFDDGVSVANRVRSILAKKRS